MARTSSRELAEWQAFERECGPLGPERGDIHAALVAHTVASAMGTGKTKFKLTDFLPRWSRRRHQTPDEQMEIFRGLAARQKG